MSEELQNLLSAHETFITENSNLKVEDEDFLTGITSQAKEFLRPLVKSNENAGLLCLCTDTDTKEPYVLLIVAKEKHPNHRDYFCHDEHGQLMVLDVISNPHGWVDYNETYKQGAAREACEELRNMFDKVVLWHALSLPDYHRIVPNDLSLYLVNIGELNSTERLNLIHQFNNIQCTNLVSAEARDIIFVAVKDVHNLLVDIANSTDKHYRPKCNFYEKNRNALFRQPFQKRLTGLQDYFQTIIDGTELLNLKSIKELPVLSSNLIDYINQLFTKKVNTTVETTDGTVTVTQDWVTRCSQCHYQCGLWADQIQSDFIPIEDFQCQHCMNLNKRIEEDSMNKQLKCEVCSKEFVMYGKKVLFFIEKGYEFPKTCSEACKEARKTTKQSHTNKKPSYPAKERTNTTKDNKRW